ncbi:hypothetical protein BU17DRAFT_79795 [Hysterangium stoloniferum]|nr:hypothetical protein BU17DRAFT_79795 [Hysterangium stoloniferum]
MNNQKKYNGIDWCGNFASGKVQNHLSVTLTSPTYVSWTSGEYWTLRPTLEMMPSVYFPFGFHFIQDLIINGTLDGGARSSSAPSRRHPDGVGDTGSRTLEEECAVLGETSGNNFPIIQSRDRRFAVVSGSVGTSILNDLSLPASFSRDPRGPFPPPHLNQFEYRNSSRSQLSDRHHSTGMPVYAYSGTPSEFVDYRHFDRQRRSANFEATIPHEYPGDNSHTGMPEVVVPTLGTPGRIKDPFEGNVFAHGESLTRSPEPNNVEHARSMSSNCGTMERNPCTEMAREPEEVSSTMTMLKWRPFITPTHPTKPQPKRNRTTPIHRAFTVRVSLLQAAAANAVFPTPLGKKTDIADFVTFITAADPQADRTECKLCQNILTTQNSLVDHWVRVHAFGDLKVALLHPHEAPNNSVANTTQRRDILLAALYTCPLKGCVNSSMVRVFPTRTALLKHVGLHYKPLKEASGEEKGREAAVELKQMEEQVSTYFIHHAFWQVVDSKYFTCRDYKLIWLLNQ